MLIAKRDSLTFKIVPDFPEVGVYLYVYRDETCLKDILQDTVEVCKDVALEDYGVRYEDWSEAPVDEG